MPGGRRTLILATVVTRRSAASRSFWRGRPAIRANSSLGPPDRSRAPLCRNGNAGMYSKGSLEAEGRPSDQMKESVLTTAANAVDHAVERRVLLVDWVVRTHQIFLRGHLASTRLAVPHRRLRKHLPVRAHRRSCGWISRAGRLRNRRRTVDKGQQGYRRDQLSHNGSPSWTPYRNHGQGKLDRQVAASLTFCSDAPARGAQGECLARRCRAYGRPDCTKELGGRRRFASHFGSRLSATSNTGIPKRMTRYVAKLGAHFRSTSKNHYGADQAWRCASRRL